MVDGDGFMSDETLHVGIIMDGNGRWATRRGLPRLKGHSQGAEAVQAVVEAAPEIGISHLTLFAFSTENWKRSASEVSGLMTLFKRYITAKADRLIAENVRVRFIGGQDRMEPKLLELMGWLEAETRDNGGLNLTIAMNYGGRDELIRAVQKLSARVQIGELKPSEISEKTLSNYMDTAEIPNPDLIIRTSGEQRISNFMPWQSAYAELAFTETLWPDFTDKELRSIVTSFMGRDRRFGAVAAQ
ncbi:MAG: polyprenyl diphosphate synthase [Pseudomonadota bacterium]